MSRRAFKWVIWLMLFAMLTGTLAASPVPAPATPGPAPYDPHILEIIEAEGEAEFYVVLKEQAHLSGAADLGSKEARGWFVYDALTEVADRTQGPIISTLAAEGATFQPFWIQNMIRVRGDKDLLLQMAARPDVAEIFFEYEPTLDVRPESAAAGIDAIEWNILRVNADDVWGLGITGAGAVVADLDTGVQWDHPALINSYRPQIPGAPGRHDYNWWDGLGGSPVPLDYDSHGTHTMGTMVGDDGGTNQIGVAPGADWIACPGIGSPVVTPIDCFQFFLAPTQLDGSNPRPDLAPHVINNSWSSATDYHDIIQVLYAAGIFYAKSAGNEGPGCGTITNPGQWPEVTAAAAFAQGDVIASFSSRGPVTIGHDVVIKPDVAAPGVNVRSSVPGGGYAPYQGTSMASPHVAGTVALLVSAKPELAGQIDILQMILKQSAEPKIDLQCPPNDPSGIPNNVWGYGILDAYAAVLMADSMGLGAIEGEVYDSGTMDPIAEAEIALADASTGWKLYDMADEFGFYDRALPAATYNITATQYGYLPGVVPGVVIEDGVTTTQDIPLDPAPIWTVAGTVTETQTGDPLAATILFEETPVSGLTDPETGAYLLDVAQGTWWMQATSPGHAGEERLVTVDQDLTEDFDLLAIYNYYMKAGEGPCNPVFEWMDASNGTQRCLSDDSFQYVNLPSGRSFQFYGTTYANLYLGSNGLVTFGVGNNKWSGPIPDPATPNNGIYAFSTDLNPASCAQGTIYTDYLDDRYFVIEYDQVQHYPDGNPETFEIILDLDTGKVTIQFQTVSDPSEAVVGVENADGSEATQYAYGDPALITDGVAVDFYPTFGTPPPTGGLGELSGTVADAGSGSPLEGASVVATAFTGGAVVTYTTDLTGTYAADLCADWYTVTASAIGYRSETVGSVPVISGTVTTLDFVLAQQEADLWLTKTGPMTVTQGANLTYTLDFGSYGPDPVPAAQIWDPLSPWVTYVSGGTYSETLHAVYWDLTGIEPGFSDTVDLVVEVSGVYTAGVDICNEADLQAGAGVVDPDPENNWDSACTLVESGATYVFLPIVIK
jgi:subtilisin family serine protease